MFNGSIFIFFDIALWMKIIIFIGTFFFIGTIQHRLLTKPIGWLVEKIFSKKYNDSH
jgi:hypothetical protein